MKRFHDIDHHSNSSLKKAINDMALWCMVYLPPRFREGTNAAMARGTATEFGVEVGLQGNEFVDPSEEAVKKFNELTALGVDGEARDKERANIPAMVEQGLEALKDYGPPSQTQERIEIKLDGVQLPIMGYTDFTWDTEGEVIDLKSTMRLPSAITAPDRRQGAIYKMAKGNHSMKFLYVTPKKVGFYELENCQQDLEEVRQTAIRVERFLALSDDPEVLRSFVIPNYDSFYWNSPATREQGRKVFGY